MSGWSSVVMQDDLATWSGCDKGEPLTTADDTGRARLCRRVPQAELEFGDAPRRLTREERRSRGQSRASAACPARAPETELAALGRARLARGLWSSSWGTNGLGLLLAIVRIKIIPGLSGNTTKVMSR